VVLLLEFVVVVPVVLAPELELDHGCQTKIAMSMAIKTTMTMPSAAAPPPSPSLTTTGPSAIQVLAPFRLLRPVIPTPGKRTHIGVESLFAMWAALGLVLALFTAVFAYIRSKRGSSNFYESDVYGMTSQIHIRYAVVSLLFGAAFVAALFIPAIPAVPVLGAFAVLFIFYFSTFLRGFSDED
jgi:hypothetical protein